MAQNKKTVYHGTSVTAAANIRKEHHFRESRTDNEWLGWGVYFFAYEQHAQRWIKNRGLSPGTVLTVQLEYRDEELLDLDDPDQLEALNHEIESLNRILKDKIVIKPGEVHENWKHWCFSCNMYRKFHPEIGMISYTFPQRKNPGASHFPCNERQICVSKHDMITEIA